MADDANKALMEFKTGIFSSDVPIFDKGFQSGSESAVARMLKTCWKAVARGGDEKNGCHGAFMDI